jgi:hypothetical protein
MKELGQYELAGNLGTSQSKEIRIDNIEERRYHCTEVNTSRV